MVGRRQTQAPLARHADPTGQLPSLPGVHAGAGGPVPAAPGTTRGEESPRVDLRRRGRAGILRQRLQVSVPRKREAVPVRKQRQCPRLSAIDGGLLRRSRP